MKPDEFNQATTNVFSDAKNDAHLSDAHYRAFLDGITKAMEAAAVMSADNSKLKSQIAELEALNTLINQTHIYVSRERLVKLERDSAWLESLEYAASVLYEPYR